MSIVWRTPASYGDVFDRLERDDIRYVVVSGVAVVLHGHARPVIDLDLVIDSAPDEARRAMATLAATGFVPTLPLPLSMATVMRMFDQSGRELDLFVRYHLPFSELWSDSVRVQVGDHRVHVVSLDHLIKVKRSIGRPHDLQDVEGLLAIS